jgi:endonuclease/exonuclease/phosphatase family metal-dependent hydrolase
VLRILTYNTQLRSWMMEVGWPPSLPPVDTAEERAAHIADNILASTAQYDIVCLNEVFDEDARAVLSKRLEVQYPYQVTKADLLYTELLRPGLLHDISNTVFDLAFQPLLDVASLLALKLEDSGIFLASRWPFELLAVPQAIVDAIGVQQAADLFPDGLVAVSFMTYGDCDGGFMADCRSAKGVLWARIRRDQDHSFDIFASHTQADDDAIEEHAEARDKQLAAAWKFVVERVGGPPFANPTFFLGDFNVPSGLAEDPPTDPPSEWQREFNTPGRPLTAQLADQWGTVQCRGGGTGLTDPGYTADVRYQPLRQRLDIIAASPGGDLVTQHVAVDYQVSTVPAGATDVSYLSDHLPLGIDLGTPHDFASPPTALRVSDVDFHSDQQLLSPGQVTWYRYDDQGTYEFRLDADDPTVYYEVYLGDDLSRPRPPYRNERHPDFGDRFVLVAPFFIKVGNRRREREFLFRFNSHRHSGIDPQDALYLIPGVSYPETFPNQQLNGDSFVSPWDDMDTKWFLLQTPRVTVPDMAVAVDLTVTSGTGPLQLLVARREPDGKATLIDRADPTSTTGRIDWRARPDESYFVCVQRQDAAFNPTGFSLLADVDISLLRGGQAGLPRLVCTKETSGWGADDISVRLKSDAGWARDISNDEIGDFEQDAVRDLAQWIPPVVAYIAGLTVTVVEEDDIDSDDVGSVTIPRFADLHAWPSWSPIHTDLTGRVEGAVTIPVDDGSYTFRCSIGRWDETV